MRRPPKVFRLPVFSSQRRWNQRAEKRGLKAPKLQFGLKTILVATAMVAVLAWCASLFVPSRSPSLFMLVATPMLCLIFFRLWVHSQH